MALNDLKRFFQEHPKVALGFSGGVDSSFLLCFASRQGLEVAPYFVKTAFQPAFELEDALRAAEYCGAELRLIEVNVLSEPGIVRNPPDRCYRCKRAIFGKIAEAAANDGYDVLIDGTNASDDAGDRPGMRALAELGVLSPLRSSGLTKADVRALSREAGLFTHDKPSYSCLATRVPCGEEITETQLRRIEESERLLFTLGFGNFRVRASGNDAKIELPERDMFRLLEERTNILQHFARFGFTSVVLDLKGRAES